ncbi:hypothetical protein [Streptomyces sp. NPDC015131]|uniref:hypothetical protein n=1 Tax=Streptomyces sp. NPDC015131 TaxID=3364941 RepID=UPI0036FA59FA
MKQRRKPVRGRWYQNETAADAERRDRQRLARQRARRESLRAERLLTPPRTEDPE